MPVRCLRNKLITANSIFTEHVISQMNVCHSGVSLRLLSHCKRNGTRGIRPVAWSQWLDWFSSMSVHHEHFIAWPQSSHSQKKELYCLVLTNWLAGGNSFFSVLGRLDCDCLWRFEDLILMGRSVRLLLDNAGPVRFRRDHILIS
jgi:hypothetical protein